MIIIIYTFLSSILLLLHCNPKMVTHPKQVFRYMIVGATRSKSDMRLYQAHTTRITVFIKNLIKHY